MNFIKNNIWTILGLAFVALFVSTGGAMAQGGSIDDGTIEGIARTKATEVFKAARNIMFIVGGFGLIAVAFMAITGKVDWKKVGAIGIGLGIIAAAGAVINYAISDDGTGSSNEFNSDAFQDTLGQN